MEVIKICVSCPGKLSSAFTLTDDGITIKEQGITFPSGTPIELIIEGSLNSEDVIFFRKLCGGGEVIRKTFKRYIEILDLSGVTFVSGGRYYFTTQNDFNTAYHKTKPQTITSYMFARLNLEKVLLPYDITTIESNAFFRSTIQTIILPDSIQLLEQESLCRCEMETLSVNAETILQRSFEICNHLREIKIGKDVKHINGAFGGNTRLESVELATENKCFKMQNNCLLNSTGTQFVLYAQETGRKKLIIPEGVERVCGGAIQGESILTELILPETLRYIGKRAFLSTNVEELHIPTEVISISNDAFPRCIRNLYFHSSTPPEINIDMFYSFKAIYVPRGCVEQYKQKIKKYASFVKEADYDVQARIPRKEVKNRAFYKNLVSEIRGMIPIEITHHTDIFSQGRFEGEGFLSVWKENLYYIKWMLRLGAIQDISNNVFAYLLMHSPVKRRAINNLKALLIVCKVKRAQQAEEEVRYRRELLEYLEEQKRYKEEQDEIELANKLFEDMMNEYDAWGNID